MFLVLKLIPCACTEDLAIYQLGKKKLRGASSLC